MVVLMVVQQEILTKTIKPSNEGREYLLTSKYPELCHDFVTMTSDYTGRFCISYPIQCVLGHLLWDSDLHDQVDS